MILNWSYPALQDFLLISSIALLRQMVHWLKLLIKLISVIPAAIGQNLLQGRIFAQTVFIFVVILRRTSGALPLLWPIRQSIDTKVLSWTWMMWPKIVSILIRRNAFLVYSGFNVRQALLLLLSGMASMHSLWTIWPLGPTLTQLMCGRLSRHGALLLTRQFPLTSI